MTDPRFPNRPDHPDFWLMSEAIIDLDAASDNGTPFQEVIGDVDMQSLAYVAQQRSIRCQQDPRPAGTARGERPRGWMALWPARGEVSRAQAEERTEWMKTLLSHQWVHRLLGHAVVERPATKADNCLTHTVTGHGFIVPIYLAECSCGQLW